MDHRRIEELHRRTEDLPQTGRVAILVHGLILLLVPMLACFAGLGFAEYPISAKIWLAGAFVCQLGMWRMYYNLVKLNNNWLILAKSFRDKTSRSIGGLDR